MAKETAKKSSAGKKTTAKKKTTPAKKTAAKKKTTAKRKTASPKKKSAAPRTVKTGTKKPARKQEVSVRDLLARKFEKMASPAVVRIDIPASGGKTPAAYISVGNVEDAGGLRPLLLKKIDYQDVVSAAEKAAAEKAAAEKAAAEKAAAEKAAEVTLTYGSDDTKGNDTMDKTVKILAGAVLAVILLLVVASFSNTGNYYLKKTDSALQIWQGNFAPKGEHLLISLPGMPDPDVVKSVYTQKDVFPLAFNYYIGKADGLLTQKGIPDFGAIKADLDKASKFAVTPAAKAALTARANTLDMLVLLYKAEAFAAKKQPADLEKALKFLDQAEMQATSDAQRALIAEKRAAVKKALEKPTAPKIAKPEMVTRASEKPASQRTEAKAESPKPGTGPAEAKAAPAQHE